jgi:transcriptional regulator with XRE-family HTH domain
MDMTQVVGGNLRLLRTAAGISLADLAAAGGVAKTTLHGIEQGQGNPTLSTLWALAALQVPLGELLEPPAPTVEVVRADDERPEARGDAVGARLLHRVRLRGTVEVYAIDVAPTIQRSAAHLPGVENASCSPVAGSRPGRRARRSSSARATRSGSTPRGRMCTRATTTGTPRCCSCCIPRAEAAPVCRSVVGACGGATGSPG